MTVTFVNDNRAFDADHPIEGMIHIDTNQSIPAYGIQLKLELIDSSKEVEHGGAKGKRYVHVWKRRAWEKTELVKCFPGNVCAVGQ